MTALDFMLNVTQGDQTELSIVPWFVRGLADLPGGGTVIYLTGDDAWEVLEDRETVAQLLLDCQAPDDEPAP